jgi:hypothetical protein
VTLLLPNKQFVEIQSSFISCTQLLVTLLSSTHVLLNSFCSIHSPNNLLSLVHYIRGILCKKPIESTSSAIYKKIRCCVYNLSSLKLSIHFKMSLSDSAWNLATFSPSITLQSSMHSSKTLDSPEIQATVQKFYLSFYLLN